MNERKNATIRGLFWALMCLSLNVNLNLFGLNIDFLPDVAGFCSIGGILSDFSEERPYPPAVRWAARIGGVTSLHTWLPGLWAQAPAWLRYAVFLANLAATILVIRAVLHLIEALGHSHGREDITENAVRLRRIYTALSLLLLAAAAYWTELSGGGLIFYFVIHLAIAAFAANANLALFGETPPTQPDT